MTAAYTGPDRRALRAASKRADDKKWVERAEGDRRVANESEHVSPSETEVRLAMIAFGLAVGQGGRFEPSIQPVIGRLFPEMERLLPEDYSSEGLIESVLRRADAAITAQSKATGTAS